MLDECRARGLILAAVVANGLLSGASLDQSIKQLPARDKIGSVAYSDYSQAGDLGNGIAFYAALGVGGALITLIAVYFAWRVPGRTRYRTWALGSAALLTIAHSVMTAFAAPTNFSQRDAAGNEARLTEIFDRFETLQTVRVILQVATLLAVVWVLTTFIFARARQDRATAGV
jgi:hypothetical protein